MYLTKIDKPFGELDDATKGALLLAHHRGEAIEVSDGDFIFTDCDDPSWIEDFIYRVQFKPVIGEVVMFGMNRPNSHILCYDGFAHCELTITFPTRDGQHVPGIYTSPDGLQIKIEVAE